MPVTSMGTAYTTYTTTLPNGDAALYAVADAVKLTADIPLILYTHGDTGAYNQFANLSAWASMRNWLIDHGIAWVESAGGGGSTWGNAAARVSYQQAYAWVVTQIDVGAVVVLGRSMGGVVAPWLYLYGAFASQCVGLILNSAVVGLRLRLGSPPGVNGIRTAYGLATDGSDWDAKLAGYDPLDFPAADWTGKKVLSLVGDADTTVPPSINTDMLRAHFAGYPTVDDLYVRPGGDHSQTNGTYLDVDPMAAFLTDVFGLSTPPTDDPTLYRALNRYEWRTGDRYALTPQPIQEV